MKPRPDRDSNGEWPRIVFNVGIHRDWHAVPNLHAPLFERAETVGRAAGEYPNEHLNRVGTRLESPAKRTNDARLVTVNEPGRQNTPAINGNRDKAVQPRRRIVTDDNAKRALRILMDRGGASWNAGGATAWPMRGAHCAEGLSVTIRSVHEPYQVSEKASGATCGRALIADVIGAQCPSQRDAPPAAIVER